MTQPVNAPRTARARSVAALLTLLEALVLFGFVAFYAYEMATGATNDQMRALTSGLLILVFAVGLLVLARGWWRRGEWPRTPTLVWNVLLLPVAWSMHDAGQGAVALGVAILAIGSIAAALSTLVGAPDRADDRSDR